MRPRDPSRKFTGYTKDADGNIIETIEYELNEDEITDENYDQLMSKIEYYCLGIKGLLQGYKRGFYKQESFETLPQCFGDEPQVLIYKIYDICYELDMGRLFELPPLIFNLYYMIMSSC